MVDDDAEYADLVAEALAPIADLRYCLTLREAVAAAPGLRPDVVLCDLHLPDADGAEAVRGVATALPRTAVVALSGVDGPMVLQALEAGAVAFVLKGGEFDGTLEQAVLAAAERTAALRGVRTPPAAADDAGVGAAAWRALAAHAPVGLFRADVAGECTWSNERCRQLTGLTAEGTLGTGWMTALHPADRVSFVTRWREATSRAQEFAMDARCRRPDGSVAHVHITASPVCADDGALIAWIGVMVDQTARRIAEREAQDSRAQLEGVVGASSSAIFLKDLDDRLLVANPACAKIFGRPAGELPGRTSTELMGPDFSETVRSLDEQVLRTGTPLQVEVTAPDGAGTDRTWLANRFAVKDADGIVTGIGVVATDISSRRRLERELERERRLLERAQEVAGAAVWSWDGTTAEVHVAAGIGHLLGTPDAAVDEIRATLHAGMAADDLGRLRELFQRSQRAPGDYELRFLCRAAGGAPVMLHSRWRSEWTATGIMIIGSTQDVTAEWDRDRRAKAAETQLRVALETAPLGFGIADADGRWVWVNAATTTLLGRTADELVGTRVDDAVRPADPDRDRDRDRDRADVAARLATLLDGEPGVYETRRRCLRPDGSAVDVRASISAVRLDGARPAHLLIQLVDERARRELEEPAAPEVGTWPDPLTGLPDHRAFERELALAAERLRSTGEGATLVLADIGVVPEDAASRRHAAVRAAAAALRDMSRQTDTVARLGGDTFGVLLPGIDADRARPVADKLAAAARSAVPEGVEIDVALGLARLDGGDGCPQAAMREAERALHSARRRSPRRRG